eukprot:jgi/Mesvir1/6231/Mv00909-RA.1
MSRIPDVASSGGRAPETSDKLSGTRAHDDYGAEAVKGSFGPAQNGGSTPAPNPEAADKAFRAGDAALHAGDPMRAVQMLRIASAHCPRDRPLALAKIEKLLALAYAALADKKAAPALQAVPEAAEPVRSSDHADGQAEAGPTPGTATRTAANAVASAPQGTMPPLETRDTGGYDEALADACYRKGVAELQHGQLQAALASLRAAAQACPPQRRAALAKIQQVVDVALSRLGGQMV